MSPPPIELLLPPNADFLSAGSVVTARPGHRIPPISAESHYRDGRAAWQRGETSLAGDHFRAAVRLAPDRVPYLCALADWSLNTEDLQTALDHSARALALAPDSPEVRVTRASALALSGEYEHSYRVIEPVIFGEACPVHAATLLAKIARRLHVEDRALALVQRLLAENHPPLRRAELHFAAAELLDKMGRYDEAFSHAAAAHDAHRRPYDPALVRRQVDLRLGYYTRQKLHSLPRATHGSRRPVFIIGMPRSGSTLVEQILSSHPDVHGAGELPLLGDIVRSFALNSSQTVPDYPACMEGLSVGNCNQLAARYLAGLSSSNPTARYVTDKMLPNFFYLGVIATLFPDAHVIHCTRDPLDTCLSCYMTDFLFGHEFAQDLSHLADYYSHYQRLMSHWRDTLKFPMVEVRYEEVVSDLEGQVRRLLETLDLPWDPACLNFHANSRHAPTASVEQVRQPLYSRSVGRWRNYANHLAPLRIRLGI